MKYLLDTHILLWSALEPNRLSPQVKEILENERNELWISPITVWEIVVLAEKGRIELAAPTPQDWVRNLLDVAPLQEASLNCETALRSRSIELSHQDPADRFIAATASVYDLILITADARLLSCNEIRTLAC